MNGEERTERTSAGRPAGAGRGEAGFTLIELLIVVAIIGILAAIAIVALQTALDKAKQRGTMADMRSVGVALEIYNLDNSRYPPNGTTMAELRQALIPYQTTVVREQDHWLHEYHYESDGVYQYTLESYGKDGIDGAQINQATRFNFDRDIVLSNGTFMASPDT